MGWAADGCEQGGGGRGLWQESGARPPADGGPALAAGPRDHGLRSCRAQGHDASIAKSTGLPLAPGSPPGRILCQTGCSLLKRAEALTASAANGGSGGWRTGILIDSLVSSLPHFPQGPLQPLPCLGQFTFCEAELGGATRRGARRGPAGPVGAPDALGRRRWRPDEPLGPE